MMPLRLRSMVWEAPRVLSLELVRPDGPALPAFTPGAHINLRLEGAGARQYSLCGDPDDATHYRVAVREVEGGRATFGASSTAPSWSPGTGWC